MTESLEHLQASETADTVSHDSDHIHQQLSKLDVSNEVSYDGNTSAVASEVHDTRTGSSAVALSNPVEFGNKELPELAATQPRSRRPSLVTDNTLLESEAPLAQESLVIDEDEQNLPTLIDNNKFQQEARTSLGLDLEGEQNAFSPNEEQLQPRDAEAQEQQTSFPWESNTEEPLPWETPAAQEVHEPRNESVSAVYTTEPVPQTEEPLPWEVETAEAASVEERHFEATPLQRKEEPLPWEQEEPLPWEEQNENGSVQNSFGNGNGVHDEPEHVHTETNEAPVTPIGGPADDFFSSLEQEGPLEAAPEKLDLQPSGGEAISKASALDEVFADDDLLEEELLEEENIKTLQESSSYVPDVPPKDTAKVKQLDFLDDDFLIDDDFLADEQVEPQSLPQHHKSYIPQSSVPQKYTVPPVAGDSYKSPLVSKSSLTSQDFNSKLQEAKKKNDAYDFPADLVTSHIKPAPRTQHTKYAPNKVSNSGPPHPPAPPVSGPPPSGLVPPASASGPPTSVTHSTISSSSPAASQVVPVPQVQPKKSFFEELPIRIPDKPVKPARVSKASAATVSPVLSRQSPNQQFHKPVVNPYASVSHPPAASAHTQGVIGPGVPPPSIKVTPGQPQKKPPVPTTNINTNLVKTVSGNSQASPYVPNVGPYAPSGHNRAHSRTSSLIGGRGREHNPYTPALPASGTHPPQPVSVPSPVQGSVHVAVPGPGPVPVPVSNSALRSRTISNPKTGLYGRARAQSMGKVQNPEALLKRQFPIFNWSHSNFVSVLIPNGVSPTFQSGVGAIHVRNSSTIFSDRDILSSFPGPLSKGKSKKKEVEKWVEINIQYLQGLNDPSKSDEILLNQVLFTLLENDGDIRSEEFATSLCKYLNPALDYVTPISSALPSMGASPNAFKLDQSGINHVFLLIQVGKVEDAVSFAISKGDWALALVLAMSLDKEKFHKVASDYARVSYPFSKSNNKVHHMMPVVLKIIAGNVKDVIEDFKNVSVEGEWFSSHWAELLAIILINKSPTGTDFFHQFGKYLKASKNEVGSEICHILAGSPLSVSTSPTEGFSYVGGFTSKAIYSEIYEYAVQMSPNAIPTSLGFPHLLPLKLKHAQVLADYGASVEAHKYCDYVGNTLKSGGKNPFFGPDAFAEFQRLLVRISDAETSDSSWFGSKISKVNLDKMWGHLDKFIGGEETEKPTENGVFSKFSPSVSRVGSVLDFTAGGPPSGGAPPPVSSYPNNPYNQFSPKAKYDGSRDPILQPPSIGGPLSAPDIYGAKQGQHASKYSPSVRQNSSISATARTPLHENLDSNSVFASSPAPISAPPSAIPHAIQAQGSVQPAFNYQSSKYAASNASSQDLHAYEPHNQANNAQPPLNRSSSKYAPGGVPSGTPSLSNQRAPLRAPYQNLAGTLSSSSVGSSQLASYAPTSVYGGPPTQQTHAANRASISSISDNFGQNGSSIRNETKSPSIQSDISLDYPSEFKAGRRPSDFSNDHEGSSKANDFVVKSTIGEESHVPSPDPVRAESQSTIHSYRLPSSNEFNPEFNNDQRNSQEPDDDHDHVDSIEETPSKPPPPKISTIPPPKGNTGKRNRPNPYALTGGASSRASSSKYSGGSSKYVNSSAQASQPFVMPEMKSTDMFNFGESEKSQEPPNPSQHHNIESSPHKHQEKSRVPQQKSVEQPPKLFRPTNVDDSFEAPDDVILETPKPKSAPLILNNRSPGNRESMFAPYQSPHETMRRASGFGIDSSFSEFPIPGSPDLTTRANSVINGMGGGLFSSRLSQSQQSAMYLQYEVQDDTVHDYVPVVDEEEEDSDDEKISKKKKMEEERKKASQRRSANQARTPGQTNNGRWLSWLNRNDDRPKAIRANMGEQNKFVYDEKLKRWINKDIPIEEQQKPSGPPPPPKIRKAPGGGPSGPAPNRAPPGPPNISTSPSAGSAPPGAPSNTSAGPAATSSPTNNVTGPPKPPGLGANPPSLATAGLDDLLSMGGSNASMTSTRRAKKGGRRGYVNVLEQK
ncbi:vesicle coat component [Yamadazyma tenuis]|uniref:vesicle coat component n=1 Tax=Candida tenuis TaxID=2315449 RepID=UPI0027A9ADEA|nr:vesicle coat component [Yamadazyma tenuis]